jgi:hypothetical protein
VSVLAGSPYCTRFSNIIVSLDALFTSGNVLKRYALLATKRSHTFPVNRLLAVLGNDFLVWLTVEPSRKLQSHGYPITVILEIPLTSTH